MKQFGFGTVALIHDLVYRNIKNLKKHETTVALLNTNDFDFRTYFALYPNPAKDVLNFEVKSEIGVKSVSVYNTLGQIVMAITNVDNLKRIDVSSLTAGSYFVKVYTDKGSSSNKFIKQ